VAEQDAIADQPAHPPETSASRFQADGPFWFAIALSLAGIAFFLFGSVTIIPWIEDERTIETARSVWLALSRHLPVLGPDAIVKAGFWVLVGLIAILSVLLLVLAATVRDSNEPTGDHPA